MRVAAEFLEDLLAERGWSPVAPDEDQFLLGADAVDAGLDAVLLEEALERAEITQDSLHEQPSLLTVETGIDVLYAQRGPPPGRFGTKPIVGVRGVDASAKVGNRARPITRSDRIGERDL